VKGLFIARCILEDWKIIELFWNRDESAIAQVEQACGAYCRAIAYNLLGSREDAEECVNETWLRAWGAIPPERPQRLTAYLGKITRNLALRRLEARRAQKRGGGQAPLVLDELLECVPDGNSPEKAAEDAELVACVRRFLSGLGSRERVMFLLRYWYAQPPEEIAKRFRASRGSVTVRLFRTRAKLKAYLEKEGIYL